MERVKRMAVFCIEPELEQDGVYERLLQELGWDKGSFLRVQIEGGAGYFENDTLWEQLQVGFDRGITQLLLTAHAYCQNEARYQGLVFVIEHLKREHRKTDILAYWIEKLQQSAKHQWVAMPLNTKLSLL